MKSRDPCAEYQGSDARQNAWRHEELPCRCGRDSATPAATTSLGQLATRTGPASHRLWDGVLYSLIGSASVATLWAAVALVWQMEVGWMAWGLGAMSGFGMACKNEGDTQRWRGIVAAAIGLAGILAAKFVVFFSVLQPILCRIEPDAMHAGTLQLFLTTMRDPIDGLFIALALATAVQLGSQGNDFE